MRMARPRVGWPVAALLAAAAACPRAVVGAPAGGGVERRLAQGGEPRGPGATEPRERDRGDAPAGPSSAAGGLPDLGKLRAEYDRIREELFKARVRSQKAAETAYPSKLDGELRWKGRPDFVIRKARFLLDGAELWDSADRAQTDDLIQIAERSVKPGPHALTVRLEIRPKVESKGGTKSGTEQLGYTSEHTFAIVVAETGKTHLFLTGDEDGDPPEYEPELELEIETEK
jgi:hypothetical protein